jgi:cytochrome c oxidase subunit 1
LLPLSHLWVAFLSFLPAAGLGLWQMLMRSPLRAPLDNPNTYYAALTPHGSIMAYVFPTFFAMGFGYAIAVSALARPLQGEKWAWVGFFLAVIGSVMAVVPVAAGHSSVLYTLYPPLMGSIWYYLGVALVIIGSYFWIGVMLVNFRGWKRDNPGKPVPLAMFAITACALLWG